MTPGLTIQLAGVSFTGRRFRWEPGVYVVSFDGPDSGGETTYQNLPGGVGILDTSNRREAPRMFTIAGFIYERSERALQAQMDRLAALLGEDDSVERLSWNLRGEQRWARVRRQSWAPPRRRAGDAAFADYTLQLRANDQRIFGTRTRSEWGTSVSVTHRGGFPAPVKIDVRGVSGTGYTVSGPRGKKVRVTRVITSGSLHTYDGDTGILRVDDVPQVEGVSRSDRIEIPFGTHQLSVDNGCELRVTFAPTWAP